MKKGLLGSIILFFFLQSAFSNQKLDKLRLSLKNSKEDTNRVLILQKLYEYYYEWYDDSASLVITFNYINSAVQLSEKLNYTTGKITSRGFLSGYYSYKQEYDKAIKVLYEAKKIAENADRHFELVDVYIRLGSIYILIQDSVSPVYFYDLAAEEAKKSNNDSALASAYHYHAYYYLTIKQDSVKGKNYYDKSTGIYVSQKNYKAAIYVSKSLGNDLVDLYKFREAINYYNDALSFTEKISGGGKLYAQSTLYDKIAIAFWYLFDFGNAIAYQLKEISILEKLNLFDKLGNANMNLGWMYYDQKQYDISLKYLNKSEKYYTQLNDTSGIGSVLLHKGRCYYEKKMYTKSIDTLLKAYNITTKYRNVIYQNFAISCLADDYIKTGNYKKALEYNLKVLKHDTTQGYLLDEDICFDLQKLSYNYYMLKDYNKALECAMKSLEFSQRSHAKDITKKNYDVLKDIYAAKGDYKTALVYFNNLSDLSDSLYNESTSKTITEMQAKFDTDKKEKEIELLNKENALQDSDIKKKNLQRNAFIVGFILMILLAGFILRSFIQKKKANKIIIQQKVEVEKQKEDIHKKNIMITDSIEYARNIQNALFPSTELVNTVIPDSFIFFQPKDLVSGDFYWVNEVHGKTFVVAADCTGHGVPGAFMSVMSINLLENAVNDLPNANAAEILNKLNSLTISTLKQNQKEDSTKDGMDIALAIIDKNKNELQFAGAHNPLYFVRNNELVEYSADKRPIGISLIDESVSFTNNVIPVQKGDIFYIASDGYPDQKGGPKKKKFYYPPFKDMLLKNSSRPMQEQMSTLKITMDEWKKDTEQFDDMLVIGVKI